MSSPVPSQPLFATTRWSVVLTARDRMSPDAAQALEALCRTYWYPLYAFVRSAGHSPEDAQDCTQEFFARLLAKDYLQAVAPEKGRFRTFLRMAMRRFLANEWDRRRAQKRGGTHTHVAFDAALAERLFQDDRSETLPPDCLYDRRWALALLDETTARLEREYEKSGQGQEWQILKPQLTADRGTIPYAEIAAALQISEGASRVAVHRLRKHFRELFREVVSDTVSTPDDIDCEMRHVLEILSKG